MPWSLVEALAETGQRRPFYLPLATASPEFSSVRQVEQGQFDPENDNTTDANDPRLRITITPPTGGEFTDEGSLPDPAIRLHAIGASLVRFKPADATHGARLEARIVPFFTSILSEFQGGYVFPSWWGRWREAGCLPARVVYENIDVNVLRQHLENVVRAPVDDQFENRVLPTHGLRFPSQVIASTRTQFINSFLAGDDDFFLEAEAGAYLGTVAAADPADNAGVNHLLVLHAEYHDHSDVNPHPMNPLELFYLLFSHDSQEALNHPLLRKINDKGQTQPGHESKSMRLRPPLRTYGRVMWEADLEIQHHAASWGMSANCSTRFYNEHIREGRHFNRSGYNTCKNKQGIVVGCWKCNLFVSEIVLRAGFRIRIHVVDTNLWHYSDANSYAKRTHDATGLTDRIPLDGKVENITTTWGWKIEGWLRSLDATNQMSALNDAMNVEGRCLILAGSRDDTGHIVIVQSVSSQPVLDDTPGHGLDSVTITTREALRGGATHRANESFGLKGTGGSADSARNFTRLHLLELHPGEDPDTARGLKDCNVETSN